MAEFTPITTQEQFDAAIGDRIKREHETIAKKYADYDDIKTKNAAYETQVGELSQSMKDTAAKYAGYDKTLADLQGKVAGYEKGSLKLRIANESGIPYELAQRLTGETEDDMRKDAQTLSQFISKPTATPPPLKSTEPAGVDGKSAALRTLTAQLTNKGD